MYKINPRNIILAPYTLIHSIASIGQNFIENLVAKQEKESCKKMFSILIGIPKENRESFAKQASSLLSEDTSLTDKVRIFTILHKIPNKNREMVVQQALRFISESNSEEDKIGILNLFSTLITNHSQRPIDLENLVTQTLKVTSDTASILDKQSIILTLYDIYLEDQTIDLETFVKQSMRLMTGTMSISNDEGVFTASKKDILKIVTTIPFQIREIIIEKMQLLLSNDRFYDHVYLLGLLEVLLEVPYKNLELVVQQSMRILRNGRVVLLDTPETIKTVTEIIADIGSDKLEFLVTQLFQIMSDNDFNRKKLFLLTILKNLGKENGIDNLESLITQSLQLISIDMSLWDKQNILVTLAPIPSEDRQLLIEQMREITSDTKIPSEMIDVLRILINLPKEDRALIKRQIDQLVTATRGSIEVKEILRMVAAIPSEDRSVTVLQSVRILLDDNGNPTSVSNEHLKTLLFILQTMPREERELIVRQLFLLIVGNTTSIDQRLGILITLSNLPIDHRQLLVTQTRQLLDETNGPNGSRDALVVQASQIIVHSNIISAFEKISVLLLLNELPIQNRGAFVRQAIQLLSADTSVNDDIDVTVMQARDLITDTMSNIERLAVLQMLNRIPSEEREIFFLQVLQRLSDHLPMFEEGSLDMNHNQLRMMIIIDQVSTIISRFEVSYDEVNKDPIKVMLNLFEIVQSKQIQLLPLSIKYIDSEGTDDGGITRSFFTALVHGFCATEDLITTNELGIIPSIGRGNSSLPLVDQEKCCKIMGRIFSAAMQGYRSIVVGSHFHPIVFQMIFNLDTCDLLEKNSYKIFDKLFSIYLKKYCNLEEQEIKNILEDSITEDSKKIYCVSSKEDFIKNYEISEKIEATIIIAKSMYHSLKHKIDWKLCRGESFEKFQERIQGILSNDRVINAFITKGAVDVDSFTYMKRWSQEATPELLKKFVEAISGVTMLPNNLIKFTVIPMNNQMDRLPIFHTCSYTVELSKYSSYEEFKEKLDLSLVHCFVGSGFQIE